MGRRRSRIGSFFDGFNAGYDTTGKVLQDYDMAQVAKAGVTTDTGYTAEQGAELERLARLKDASGNALYDIQASTDGKYTVRPVGADPADASQTASMEPGQRHTYLGETRDTPFSQQDRDRARLSAMAGVMEKHGDPMRAMELRGKAADLDYRTAQLDLSRRADARAERAENRADDVAKREETKFGWEQDKQTRQDTLRQDLAQAAATHGMTPGAQSFQDSMRALVAKHGSIDAALLANNPSLSQAELEQAKAAYQASYSQFGEPQKLRAQAAAHDQAGDPATAQNYVKLAEAMEREGLPKVLALLRQPKPDIDEANRVWNSSGGLRNLIQSVGKDKNGRLFAKVVDADGKASAVNLDEVEAMMMSAMDKAKLGEVHSKTRENEAQAISAEAAAQASRAHAGLYGEQAKAARAEREGGKAPKFREQVNDAVTKVLQPRYGGKFDGMTWMPNEKDKDVALRAYQLAEQKIGQGVPTMEAAKQAAEQAERERATGKLPIGQAPADAAQAGGGYSHLWR